MKICKGRLQMINKAQQQIIQKNFMFAVRCVNDICKQFNVETIYCSLNSYIYRVLGFFQLRYKDEPMHIEFSKKAMLFLDEDQIEKVAIHEALHYVCFKQGKDYDDGDEYFENMLVKFNASSNFNYDLSLGLTDYQLTNLKYFRFSPKQKHYYYILKCKKCGHVLMQNGKPEKFYHLQDLKEYYHKMLCPICNRNTYEYIRKEDV